MSVAELKPHPGPQTKFLSSPADIAIYGGAAGGGKTFALLIDKLRHVHRAGYFGLIFRRTAEQVTNAGGLWDEAEQLFPQFGGVPQAYKLRWSWPSGSYVKFANMQYEANKINYQGAQAATIDFDELTHFSESMFFYMLSRLRTQCGIKPYVRGTCNPDPDSWLATFLSWWIDEVTGYPIAERSGVLRWMFRHDNRVHWFDSRDAAASAMAAKDLKPLPKSVTFIPAQLADNPSVNPEYESDLMAMQLVDRERLLGGNWKIRETAGFLFNRSWLARFLDAKPLRVRKAVRYWDKAASENGDFSAGVLIAQLEDGTFAVIDVVHGQWTPAARDAVIRQTAILDQQLYPGKLELWIEQEGGSGGKESALLSAKDLAAFAPHIDRPVTGKVERSKALSAQCEVGNVAIVRAAWNSGFIEELVAFPDGKHDDMVDAAAGAFNRVVFQQSSGGAPRGMKTH